MSGSAADPRADYARYVNMLRALYARPMRTTNARQVVFARMVSKCLYESFNASRTFAPPVKLQRIPTDPLRCSPECLRKLNCLRVCLSLAVLI
jgi:hypothetical protein